MNGPSEHGISGESMIGWGAIVTAVLVYVVKLLPKLDPRLLLVWVFGPMMRRYIEPVRAEQAVARAECAQAWQGIKADIRLIQRTIDHMPGAEIAHARVREEDEEEEREREQWRGA